MPCPYRITSAFLRSFGRLGPTIPTPIFFQKFDKLSRRLFAPAIGRPVSSPLSTLELVRSTQGVHHHQSKPLFATPSPPHSGLLDRLPQLPAPLDGQLLRQRRPVATTPFCGLVGPGTNRGGLFFSPAGHHRASSEYLTFAGCQPLERRPGRPGRPAQVGNGYSACFMP